MSKPLSRAVLVILSAAASQLLASASISTWNATDLFDKSVTHHLQLSKNGIELETGELFEDDGPASGRSYRTPENRETVSDKVWIRKDLIVPNPLARAAYLVVLSEEPIQALINGVPQALGQNQSGRKVSQTYPFDPKLLKAGRNEIVLRDSGRVFISRDDEFASGSRTRTTHPNRSAKSTDAGKTWDYRHLGPDGQLDGEYGIRLFLDHYRAHGLLTTPVLDVGNLDGKSVPVPLVRAGPLKLSIDADLVPGGHLDVMARTGDTYVPATNHWSDWQRLAPRGGTVQNPRGRYVQLQVELSTTDPLQSPTLRNLQLQAAPVFANDWTSRIRIVDAHNELIVRTSIPFEYEPLDHPHLRQLREQYKLDDLVKGSTNELELMLRLAQWACNSWDWPNHIGEDYPPWDALEILKPYADGKPTGGFCQQFNLVFLQACESFGFNGRAISISQGRCLASHPGGGHEIVELWSNEWKKWVYVDGALAWYVVDPKTGIPLSIWELRQKQLPTLKGETVEELKVIDATRTRNKQFTWSGLGPQPLNWYLELRMIPRSNFLQQKSPLPLNQGTEEWSWTGHYVWTDDIVPAGFLFGNRVAKHQDFEWTLNQAHYELEPDNNPGVFRVHLDTETPSFDTFLAELDGGPKAPVVSGFAWKLHPGRNSLRVKPRNVCGRDGIASWIELEYQN